MASSGDDLAKMFQKKKLRKDLDEKALGVDENQFSKIKQAEFDSYTPIGSNQKSFSDDFSRVLVNTTKKFEKKSKKMR